MSKFKAICKKCHRDKAVEIHYFCENCESRMDIKPISDSWKKTTYKKHIKLLRKQFIDHYEKSKQVAYFNKEGKEDRFWICRDSQKAIEAFLISIDHVLEKGGRGE